MIRQGGVFFCFVFFLRFYDMSFGSSHLAVGDPLGDRFWLSPKKGESVAVGCGRRVSPEPDVCVRRGCGHVSGQQLCNNCSVQSAAQGQGLMQQSSEDFFFFSFLFVSLLNSGIHAARVSQSSGLQVGCVFTSQLFTGDGTRERRAVSNLTSCAHCCWGNFATQWESCPPPTSAPS